ncbi:hypothetical protein FJ872_33015, partial [Mesorhizobium sp. B2-5-9]|uniref:hypothetical protein n=1 Tax=Mesorhizobium sp. B2-5-9 TaxID=2589921 RepID=UPI001126F7ED
MFRKRRSLVARQAIQAKAARQKTFPAPIAGWVTADSLIGARPASALRLENWFPQQMSARVRGGTKWWNRLPEAAVSMMTYRVSGQEKLFASTATAIYDVTSAILKDDYLFDNDGEVLTDEEGDWIGTKDFIAALGGQTSGYYSYVNFSTSGGDFLVAVNGTDLLLLYDGSDWNPIDDASDIAIIGVDTDTLSFVSAYRNRLFFVQRGSMKIWYLPVNSVGGTAVSFNLSGIFEGGGAVLFTATWSMDAGDGLDDKFIVVSTHGEVAVYQGSNPSDAADWSLVGRYQITEPLGPRATMRAGGDLVIATEEGLVPISSAVNKDTSALSLDAISRAIEPDWTREAAQRRALNWEVVKWPQKKMALVSLPTTSTKDSDHFVFVINTETGAWAKYTGWDCRCMEIYAGNLYFGTSDGRILQAEIGGDDDGNTYYPIYVGNWDAFDAPERLKTIHQARATFISATAINPHLSISADYTISLPASPTAPDVDNTANVWDVGRWDVMRWDVGGLEKMTISTRWTSIGQSGYALATGWMTSSSSSQPTARLPSIRGRTRA